MRPDVCQRHGWGFKKERASGYCLTLAPKPGPPIALTRKDDPKTYKWVKYCHKNTSVQRDFLVAVYIPNDDGRMVVETMPTECPCCEAGVECKMSLHQYRQRKTGPKHPLAIVKCESHRRFYTVYPLGYVPYKRAPLVPEGNENSGCDDLTPWLDTVFESAVRAGSFGESCSWSMEFTGEKSWWTQMRQTRKAGEWLGLNLIGLEQQRVAQKLRVGAVIHAQACRIYRESSTLKRIAAAVVMVLAALEYGKNFLWSLLRTGKSTGLCGQAWMVMRSGKPVPFR